MNLFTQVCSVNWGVIGWLCYTAAVIFLSIHVNMTLEYRLVTHNSAANYRPNIKWSPCDVLKHVPWLSRDSRRKLRIACWKCFFSLAEDNEVEGIWNVTRRSRGIGSIVCRTLVSYPSTYQGQIHTSTGENDSTCVTQPPKCPSINTAHLREKIRLRTAA